MELFKSVNIDWLGKRYLFFGVSGVLILLGIAGLFIKGGPVYGIDFTGGTMLQIDFKELPPIDDLRQTLNDDGWSSFTVQTQPVEHSIIIRLKEGERSQEDISGELMETLRKKYEGNVAAQPDRVEYVGPVIGKLIIRETFLAIFGSLAVIIIYVAIRFKTWTWGIAGVIALAHDVFVTFGILTLLHIEITLIIVAALLTLAGYSINDTIVIFDRVRENLRQAKKGAVVDLYNRSINETLSRSIITSFTTFMAATALFIWGGEVLRDFAFTIGIGIILGSYSTIGVAIGLVHEIDSARKH